MGPVVTHGRTDWLFEIGHEDGSRWRVYEDGTCDGFPDGAWIRNHAAPLLNSLRAKANGEAKQ